MEEVKTICADIFRIISKRYVMLLILLYPLYLNGIFLRYVIIPTFNNMIFSEMNRWVYFLIVNIERFMTEFIIGGNILLPVYFYLFKVTTVKRFKFCLTLATITFFVGKIATFFEIVAL